MKGKLRVGRSSQRRHTSSPQTALLACQLPCCCDGVLFIVRCCGCGVIVIVVVADVIQVDVVGNVQNTVVIL